MAATNMHEEYKCIKDLKAKMQMRLDQIEEYLNIAISKQCIKFERSNYLKLINSYNLLDKSQIFIDQLNMNFVNAIHTCALKTIVSFLIDNYNVNIEEIKRKQYKELCEVTANFVSKFYSRKLTDHSFFKPACSNERLSRLSRIIVLEFVEHYEELLRGVVNTQRVFRRSRKYISCGTLEITILLT